MNNNASPFKNIESAFNYLARHTTGFDIDLEFHTPTQRPKLILTKDDPDIRLAIDPIATDLTGADNDYVITTYEHGTHWLVLYTNDDYPGIRIEEAEATTTAFTSTAMPFDHALNRIAAIADTYTDTPNSLTEEESTNSMSTHVSNTSDDTDTPVSTDNTDISTDATLHFDGASRGNPGKAATGYVLNDTATNTVSNGTPLGKKTNNEAEYHALIEGIETALTHDVESLTIYGDSKLIINQITGNWDCNSNDLKPLLADARELLAQLDSWTVEHVPRDENAGADNAANTALDNAV